MRSPRKNQAQLGVGWQEKGERRVGAKDGVGQEERGQGSAAWQSLAQLSQAKQVTRVAEGNLHHCALAEMSRAESFRLQT